MVKMGQRSGTLLERNVSRLFRLVGFNPQNNVFIEGYEIDVFVQVESYNIVIECKQYERSSLSVRNWYWLGAISLKRIIS